MAATTYDVGHEATIQCLAHNDTLGASGDEAGFVIVWDQDGKSAGKMAVGEMDVSALVFAPSGEPYLYAACGKVIYCYDLRSLTAAVDTFNVNTDDINELHIRQKYLAACDDSGQIKLINLGDKRVRTLKNGHENICTTMDFRPDFNSEILSGGQDSRMVRWDIFKTKAMKCYDMKSFVDNEDRTEYLVSPPMVHCLRCSPGGATALALENGTVQIFESGQKPLVNKGRFLGHTKRVSQVHFLANDVLVSGADDGLLVVHKFEMTNQHRWSAAQTCIAHGSAVNWLMSWDKMNNKILVADQTQFIGVKELDS